MTWAQVFAAVAIPLVIGSFAQHEEAKAKSKQASRQYDLTMAETSEGVRRAELTHGQQVSRARALAGASGVKYGGSTEKYVKAMEKNFSVERDWMQKAGHGRATADYLAAADQRESAGRAFQAAAAGQVGAAGARSYYRSKKGTTERIR